MPLGHAAPSPPQLPDPTSYLDTLLKTGSESIEVILRKRRILFAGLVARMEDTSLPEYVMFGELVGGAGSAGRQNKECIGCLLYDLRVFGIHPDKWTIAAQDEGECCCCCSHIMPTGPVPNPACGSLNRGNN